MMSVEMMFLKFKSSMSWKTFFCLKPWIITLLIVIWNAAFLSASILPFPGVVGDCAMLVLPIALTSIGLYLMLVVASTKFRVWSTVDSRYSLYSAPEFITVAMISFGLGAFLFYLYLGSI